MMVTKLKHIIKGYLQPSALVLMYHRVDASMQDAWNIAVHPDLFEQQLEVLQTNHNVLPLSELIERAHKNSLPRNSLAITFDDGYQDNYLQAKPLLEKYRLPATFFIATGNTGTVNEFWWDELEELLLKSPSLPVNFKMTIAGTSIETELAQESLLDDNLQSKLRFWKAFVQEPDTQRGKLFLQLWLLIRPLPATEQQQYLAQLKEWAGGSQEKKNGYKCMTSGQIQELANHPLFEVGGHTVTHPLLSSLDRAQQYHELKANQDTLQEITGKPISTCSFPYGAYNADSLVVVQQMGYAAALTTQEKRINHQTNPFQLGRIQVPNLSKPDFRQFLSHPR
ncbi:polysaccharide deacetylase family protein [Nibribacter koreensis]|uniref:NodB homology domain-containing protein n=1 Tax=Nibribacter koreensis TaxID=1084519 RepID=A0ABP8FH45_9BACT